MWQVLALRYAHHERNAQSNFLMPVADAHDAMPMDYFVWLLRGPGGREILVDTGFDEETAARRGRTILRPVADCLRAVGTDPASIRDVIVSHLHYDHAGNLGLFPNATFHIQDREMQFCTGRCMCHAVLRHSFAIEDVTSIVRRVFEGRVQFHDGDVELAPGLSLHFIGGHTMGLQSVRVMTRRGAVMVASDAAHLYAHLEQNRIFPVIYNAADMLEGQKKLRRLVSTPAHIVPGHDPLVMQRYPAAAPNLANIVVRLDADPAT
jgi:glyoxylase-like metal-dependent hydrolase (beta-lactamase superfamily II)